MRNVVTAALLMGLMLPCSPALAGTPVEMVANAQADKIVAGFIAQVRAGQTTSAVDTLFRASPTMNGRTAGKQQLASQTDSVIRIYGKITAVELVESNQHENMLTRWEFDLARLPDGN